MLFKKTFTSRSCRSIGSIGHLCVVNVLGFNQNRPQGHPSTHLCRATLRVSVPVLAAFRASEAATQNASQFASSHLAQANRSWIAVLRHHPGHAVR